MNRRELLGLGALAGGLLGLPRLARARSARAAALEAHTRFLAHDLLEGRDTGTRGYDIAAAYVASQFQIAGLAPAGTDGWFQELRVRRRILEASEIEYRLGSDRSHLVNGEDVAIDASATQTDERLDLEMVFVGWGIDAPGIGIDDYRNRDVAGKAVVLLEGAPGFLPPAVRAHFSWIQQKERMAAARGAVAVLSIKSPARERVSPWERARVLRPGPAVSWIGEQRAGEAVPPAATMTLGPRFASTLIARAGRSIEAVFDTADKGLVDAFALPGRIAIARRSRHEDRPSANVIGRIRGSDPSLADEHFVAIAHLDHVGIGPAVNGDSIYNGAVDNAGGVAVMLEVARALARGAKPRRSLLFIAATGEERGLLGSDYFVSRPTVPLEQVVGALSIDGLMAFHDFSGIVALGADHSTLGAHSAAAASAIGARHVADPNPDRGNLALSDQYPFLRSGIPVLFPNPARGASRSGSDDTAAWDAYEERYYHQPSDDIDLPLRWDVAERWADYIERFTALVAADQHPPRWYEADPLADVFARDAPRVRR